MALLRGPGGNLLRGPGGNVTRDPNCCCDATCYAEYIPCCMHRADWPLNWSIAENFQLILDRDVTVTLVDDMGPIDSVNVAFFDPLEGGRNYLSGWNVWDFGPDITEKLFRPPGPVGYVLAIALRVRHVGTILAPPGDPSTLTLTASDITLTTSAGQYVLPFNSWTFNPPYSWVINGNQATSEILQPGDSSIVTATFLNCPDRELADFGPEPCEVPRRWKETGPPEKCWLFLSPSDTPGGTTGELPPLVDCIAEPACGCYCQEVPKMCDCLADPTAFNTTRNGIRRVEVAAADPAGNFTLQMQYLPSGGWGGTQDLYWSGFEGAQLQPVVTLGWTGGGVLLVEIWYISSVTGNVIRDGVSGGAGVFTFNDNDWNQIQIDWDAGTQVVTLTVNGDSLASAPLNNYDQPAAVPNLGVMAGNVAIGSGAAAADLHTTGCYRAFNLAG